MGGSGSGWRGTKKTTVEEGLTLSITRLVEKKVIGHGQHRTGIWGWSYGGSKWIAHLSYEVNTVDPANAWFRIEHHVNGKPIDYRIRLETTSPHWGGVRWWFICPCSGRRATKLHLPPGGTYFARREVYDLTYRSCQESGKFRKAFYRDLADKVGVTVAQLRAMLN